MMRKRFRKDEEEEVDEEVGSKKGKKKRGNAFLFLRHKSTLCHYYNC